MTSRILVVADDIALAEMIGIVLRTEGFAPLFRADGTAMFSLVRNMGQGVGISIVTAVLSNMVQGNHEELGERLRMLVGKPGLDGHSNGAEQVAVRARDVGFEVIYQGIRLTPSEIVAAAVQEGVHVVGLSVLSGSHLEVVPAVVDGLRAAGADDVPVVVGGIIPEGDATALRDKGVAAVFTPKDFRLTEMMDAIVTLVREAHGL